MAVLYSIADVYQGLSRTRLDPTAQSQGWMLSMIESGAIRDDGWLDVAGLQDVGTASRLLVERHVLRPYDVLVTARTGIIKVALVPPNVVQIVAGITLLVVRPDESGLGFGHWIWYYLTSTQGREQLSRRMTINATTTSLSARSVADIEIPIPSLRELDAVAHLVEASEAAYTEAMNAARLRRETVRDSVIEDIRRRSATG